MFGISRVRVLGFVFARVSVGVWGFGGFWILGLGFRVGMSDPGLGFRDKGCLGFGGRRVRRSGRCGRIFWGVVEFETEFCSRRAFSGFCDRVLSYTCYRNGVLHGVEDLEMSVQPCDFYHI